LRILITGVSAISTIITAAARASSDWRNVSIAALVCHCVEDLSLAAFADAIAVAVQIVERILSAAFEIAAESLAAFQGFNQNFRIIILKKNTENGKFGADFSVF
jgi:hypothetical protein